jgi:hypothetical protein
VEGNLMPFQAALSGSSIKAPGFAGGYLLTIAQQPGARKAPTNHTSLAKLALVPGVCMRGLINIAIACCALFASSCTTVPALQEASGVSETGPLVSQVVNSVKCEIIESLVKLRMDPSVNLEGLCEVANAKPTACAAA